MSLADQIPLLEQHDEETGYVVRQRWWSSFIDVYEAKGQVLFAVPMILTNASYYGITLVSVMLAGRSGDLELAGATLAQAWATVTGLALMVMSSLDSTYNFSSKFLQTLNLGYQILFSSRVFFSSYLFICTKRCLGHES